MLQELAALFSSCPPEASRTDYLTAIVDDNVLGKATSSTRRLTAQRLSELYALDTVVPVFRALRRFWEFDKQGQPLLALLCALARDPLLRSTIPSVIELPPEASFDREAMKDSLRRATKERLNESILDKVVRNAGSSWTQSGHLEGRTFKRRQPVRATAGPVAMALFLGYLQGIRGPGLLSSTWVRVLDVPLDALSGLARTAGAAGMLRYRKAGEVVEVVFPDLLTPDELEALYEQN